MKITKSIIKRQSKAPPSGIETAPMRCHKFRLGIRFRVTTNILPSSTHTISCQEYPPAKLAPRLLQWYIWVVNHSSRLQEQLGLTNSIWSLPLVLRQLALQESVLMLQLVCRNGIKNQSLQSSWTLKNNQKSKRVWLTANMWESSLGSRTHKAQKMIKAERMRSRRRMKRLYSFRGSGCLRPRLSPTSVMSSKMLANKKA